jgi:O-antigen ligase
VTVKRTSGAVRAMAPSLPHPTGGLAGAAALGLICIALGGLLSRLPQPALLVVATVVACGVLWTAVRWGTLGLLVILVAVTPLLPVVSGVYGQPRSYAGIDGSTLRIVGIGVLSIIALMLERRDAAVGPRPFVVVRGLLLALAALGVVSALFTAEGSADFLKLTAQAAGQPLFYAIVLTLFITETQGKPHARQQLLRAWCIAIVAEAAICVGQVATGAAHDPIRGITRAQGTIGADALGAFAMVGVFGALALRACADGRRDRVLAAWATVGGLAMLVLSLARGPAIAFAVALVITAVPGRAQLSAKRLSTFFIVVMLAGIALYASKGLWLARLDAPTTAGFDRPATWVAGLRLIHDHPLIGVGSTHVVTVVGSSSRYSQTQFGRNNDLPHNAWLYAAAANGALYGVVLLLASVLFAVELARCKGPPDVRYLKAGLLGLALVFFTNNLFNHPEIMLVVLLAGAAIATSPDPVPARPRVGSREARSVPRASAPEPNADVRSC